MLNLVYKANPSLYMKANSDDNIIRRLAMIKLLIDF
jgi:hypothetical protein